MLKQEQENHTSTFFIILHSFLETRELLLGFSEEYNFKFIKSLFLVRKLKL